jgi:ubiquinone/menaquinone biosynthesis C-methylase UbiE
VDASATHPSLCAVTSLQPPHYLLQVLDVGIGTAFALCMNASEVLSKDLSVVGIDIDEHYIKGAEQNCIKCARTSPASGPPFCI